jgi:hypothetical protein
MRAGSVLGECTAVADIAFAKIEPLITDEGVSILLGLDGRAAGLACGADPSQALIWVHGSYWYQGEYAYAPHPDGTRVTYRIRNISGHPDFLIRLWQRRLLRTQQRDLDTYAAALPARIE